MTASIRQAAADDVGDIISLIRELADYEKLLGQVNIDPTHFTRELFGENPVCFCFMAHVEGALAGFILSFYNFSTFLGRRGIYIEDLYVRPQFRGHGIGQGLINHVIEKAKNEGCGCVEWQVLDWNTPSIAFYEKLGAHHKAGWLTYQLPLHK